MNKKTKSLMRWRVEGGREEGGEGGDEEEEGGK